jgi:hypothetical protein
MESRPELDAGCGRALRWDLVERGIGSCSGHSRPFQQRQTRVRAAATFSARYSHTSGLICLSPSLGPCHLGSRNTHDRGSRSEATIRRGAAGFALAALLDEDALALCVGFFQRG